MSWFKNDFGCFGNLRATLAPILKDTPIISEETINQWMLEDDKATRTQCYDSTAFTSFMSNAKSDSKYMQCDHCDKNNKKMNDKTKCIMLCDIEILLVCSRAAQNTYQIDFRGIVNTTFVNVFNVLSLFWYMFVTIYRHTHTTDSKIYTILKFFVYISILSNAGFLFFYYCRMNWGFVNDFGWWTDLWTWNLHQLIVLFASTLGVSDVVCVFIVFIAEKREGI